MKNFSIKILSAVVAGFALSVAEAETYVDPMTGIEWNYTVNGDGTVSLGVGDPYVTAVPSATSGALTVPAVLDGRPVTCVGEYAFAGCDALSSVTLPSGVTNIGYLAFALCEALSRISMPSGLKEIGPCAFQGCGMLKSVAIPSGVAKIGMSAFEMCSSLESVTLPAGLESIGGWTFYACESLSGVTFLGDAPATGERAFWYVAEGCEARVLAGTEGWPEAGGEWNGLAVAHLSFMDGTVPEGLAVAPGASFEVAPSPGGAVSADGAAALAARVKIVPRDSAQDVKYFKTTATIDGTGTATIWTELDLVALEFAATSGELLEKMMSAPAGADATLSLTTAKKGFWYSVKTAKTPTVPEDAVAAVAQAGAGGVSLTVARPVGASAFFKVEISDRR